MPEECDGEAWPGSRLGYPGAARNSGKSKPAECDGSRGELPGAAVQSGAGLRARKRVGPEDLGKVDWNPASELSDEMKVWSSSLSGRERGGDKAQLGRREGGGKSSNGSKEFFPSPSLSSPLSPQAPSSPSMSVQLPPHGPSFDTHCVRLDALDETRGNPDCLTYDELHQLRRRRGRARKDSKAALKMDAMARKQARDAEDAMEMSGDSPEVRGRRSSVDDLHLAFAAEKWRHKPNGGTACGGKVERGGCSAHRRVPMRLFPLGRRISVTIL